MLDEAENKYYATNAYMRSLKNTHLREVKALENKLCWSESKLRNSQSSADLNMKKKSRIISRQNAKVQYNKNAFLAI